MPEPLLLQQLRGGGSVAGLHEQHLFDAMLGVFRHAVPVGACEGVLPFPDPSQDGVVCGSPKGGVPHKQDVHDHTSAPDIAAALVSRLSQNLHDRCALSACHTGNGSVMRQFDEKNMM